MTGNEQFEREFAAFLKEEDSRVAALYRKLPRHEPDARLDAAVHAMAHRALNPHLVATPRQGARRPGPARWLPALGAAAGVVLAAGIALKLAPTLNDREYDRAPASEVISVRSIDAPAVSAPPLSPPPPSSQPTTAPAGNSMPPAAPRPSAKMQAVPQAAAAAAAPQQSERASKRNETPGPADGAPGDMGFADSLNKVEKAASPAARAQGEARKRAMTEAEAVERRETMTEGAWQNLHDRDAQLAGKVAAGRDDSAADVRAKSITPQWPVTSGVAAPAKPNAPPAMAAPARTPAPVRDEARAEPKPFETDAYGPATPAVPPVAREMPREAPAAAPEETVRTTTTATPPPPPSREAAPAPKSRDFAPAPPPTQTNAPAATANAQSTMPAPVAGAAKKEDALDRGSGGQTPEEVKQKPALSKDPNARLYPEHWLANIRTMLKENRRDEALRSLAEFRKMYPDYALPAELRDLK